VTQEVWRRRYALIDTIGDWHKAKDTLPVTLAHNDFNQRNVGFRHNGHAFEPPPEPPRDGAVKSEAKPHRFLPHLFRSKKSRAADEAAVAAEVPVPAVGSNRPTEVVALDWEIAQRNIAARDLVELLTFVLPPTVERAQVDRHVETHRDALIKAGVATGVERDAFTEGFRCELRVQAINRVGLQLLFGAQFQLPYLARINGTVERLLDLYD
jgi:hypothetical protein